MAAQREELAKLQYKRKNSKGGTFNQLIMQWEEQGPPKVLEVDAELRNQVNSMVFDLIRSMFAKHSLPFRDITFENMFRKVKRISKIPKKEFEKIISI